MNILADVFNQMSYYDALIFIIVFYGISIIATFVAGFCFMAIVNIIKNPVEIRTVPISQWHNKE